MYERPPSWRFGWQGRKSLATLLAVTWLGLVLCDGSVWSKEQQVEKAKTPSEKDQDLKLIALTYGLEIREADRWRRYKKEELAEREFGAGDFFRLVISPLDDCYVYVINKSGDGPARVIFPAPGRELRLQRDSGERIIPGPDPIDQRERYFEFREPRRTEKLYVVATPRKVDSRENLTKVVVEQLERNPAPDRPAPEKPASESRNRAKLAVTRDAARPPTGVAMWLREAKVRAKIYADDLRFKIRPGGEVDRQGE